MSNTTNFKYFRYLLFVICLFVVFALFPNSVSAQTFDLSITPPIIEVMIRPGKTVTYAYTLENGGEDLILNSQIVPFTPKDELGNILLKSGSSETPDYFSFNNTATYLGVPFTLKRGESKQVVLKISVPKDAEERDYYLTLLFASQNEPKPDIPGTVNTGIIGSNILLTISDSGKPLKRGEITQFSVNNARFSVIDSFDMPDFLLRLKNYGKTYWKPTGKITVNGVFGQKWNQDILPENVLADSVRAVQISTPSAEQHFLLGVYQAKAEFTPDEENPDQIIVGTISFVALPIKTIIYLLTTLFIIIIFKVAGIKLMQKFLHH